MTGVPEEERHNIPQQEMPNIPQQDLPDIYYFENVTGENHLATYQYSRVQLYLEMRGWVAFDANMQVVDTEAENQLYSCNTFVIDDANSR